MVRHRVMCKHVLWLVASVCAVAQARQRAPKTVTQVFEQSVSGPERAILSLANAMPEAQYSFVPTNGEFKGVRSFAQLGKHVAVDNYMMGAALLREKVPIDIGVRENGPDAISTKTQVAQFLQDSFTYLHKAVHTVNQRNLMEPVNYDGVPVPRLSIVNAAISHPWDIYGQMIEYLRMNGVDPQKAQ